MTNLFLCLLAFAGFAHTPMPLDTAHSLDAEAAAKEVLAERVLHDAAHPGRWSHSGAGGISVQPDGATTLSFSPDPRGRRAIGSPDDPDYAVYGHSRATLHLDNVALDDYNRLEIDIEPRYPGCRVVNINLSFANATGARGAGFNVPTGAHLIHLKNNAYNRCFLEIADFKRDAMRELSLSVTLNGMDLASADTAVFRIVRVAAQRVPATEKVSGWMPDARRIIHSGSGYAATGAKTAILEPQALKAGRGFRLVDEADGSTAFSGFVERQSTSIGTFGVVDFTAFTRPGRYHIEACGLRSEPFSIGSEDIWEPSCWKVLNFIFCQRCGYHVPGVHSHCHIDLMSAHGGVRKSYSGGWHDAGDLSQQTLQTADVVFSLLELYESKKRSNPELAARLREEAMWGLDFVLRCRYGDGYHASSMGLLIWQDGTLGSFDDIHSVRVQNLPFDNFLYAAYEAYAARVLDDDPELCSHLVSIAREDYDFAEEKYAADGYAGWISTYEHTYCTGMSQFMATASWAASQLLRTTSEARYAADAARYAEYVLDSQCTEPVGHSTLKGFFFRTPDKRTPVHFIHQSREQVFMQALTELCRTQPTHPDCKRWHAAIENYAGYLKALMAYTAPYGMLPSGVYRRDEPADTEAFYALHLFPPADAREQFAAQAAKGVDVGDGYFVKRFPVWFNIFNGNLAVHASMGKAAGICANFLGDDELMDIAREQMYWIAGKNPFAQSLIYGEGYRYPSLNNFSSGELTGAMPVGIRSLADSDEPYWPQINNACYKEVWLTSAGKWLGLVAETQNNETPKF